MIHSFTLPTVARVNVFMGFRPLADALNRFGRRPALPLMVSVVALILWQVAAQADTSRLRVIPAPSEILTAFWRTRETLLTLHIPTTIGVTLLGLALSILLGLALATLLDFFPLLKRMIYPLLVISQTIPIIALATVLILVFGFDVRPKLTIVILFCFFPIVISTLDALSATDPDLIALLRAMGANRWQIWRKIRFPSALPAFFSGCRIAATYSVTGAITGEYVTSQYGLGQYMRTSYSAGKTDQVFAAIVIVSVLSMVLVLVVSAVERALVPWFFATSRATQWDEPGIY